MRRQTAEQQMIKRLFYLRLEHLYVRFCGILWFALIPIETG